MCHWYDDACSLSKYEIRISKRTFHRLNVVFEICLFLLAKLKGLSTIIIFHSRLFLRSSQRVTVPLITLKHC